MSQTGVWRFVLLLWLPLWLAHAISTSPFDCFTVGQKLQCVVSTNATAPNFTESWTGLWEVRLSGARPSDVTKFLLAIPRGLASLRLLALPDNRLLSAVLPQLTALVPTVAGVDLSNNSLDVVPTPGNARTPIATWQRLILARNRLRHLNLDRLARLAPNLTELDLSYNQIQFLDFDVRLSDRANTSGGHSLALRRLDLSHNALVRSFPPVGISWGRPGVLSGLDRLDLSVNPHLLTVDLSLLAVSAPNLRQLVLRSCSTLRALHSPGPHYCMRLHYLDVSDTVTLHNLDLAGLPNLSFVNATSSSIATIEGLSTEAQIDADYTWNWRCDCRLYWLLNNHNAKSRLQFAFCKTPKKLHERSVEQLRTKLTQFLAVTKCQPPKLSNCTTKTSAYSLGESARLECRFNGEPRPLVKWQTPMGKEHRRSFVPYQGKNDKSRKSKVLDDGSLYIARVETTDAGRYEVVAENPLGRIKVDVELTLSYDPSSAVPWHTQILGTIGSASLIGFAILFALAHCIIRRCSPKERSRRRSFKRLVQAVETYRCQRIASLRESYSAHVNRVKTACIQHALAAQEQYNSRLARIKENCESRLDRIRSTYAEQIQQCQSDPFTIHTAQVEIRVEVIADGSSNGLSSYHSTSLNNLSTTNSISPMKPERRASALPYIGQQWKSDLNCQLQSIRAYASREFDSLQREYSNQQLHCIGLLEALSLEQWRACTNHIKGNCRKPDVISPATSVDFYPPQEKAARTVFDIYRELDDFVLESNLNIPLGSDESINDSQIFKPMVQPSSDSDGTFITADSEAEATPTCEIPLITVTCVTPT